MAEDAEGVGLNIDVTVLRYDVTTPSLVDDFTRRVDVGLGAVLLIAKPIVGGEQRPTGRRRLEGDVCEYLGKITPDRAIVLRQRLVIHIVRCPDQSRDSLQRIFQCGAWNFREHCLAQAFIRHIKIQ